MFIKTVRKVLETVEGSVPSMLDRNKKRYRLRIVIPAFPAFNVYSRVAKRTTALGPVCVASVVNEMENWDVEVIDENNLRRYGPRNNSSRGADHNYLQNQRPADVVGFYGGLTSAVPRLYEIARFYKDKGALTIGGGQHFVEDNITEALNSGIDYVVLGEGEETIKELLRSLEGAKPLTEVKGIAYLQDGETSLTEPREPLRDFDHLPPPNFSLVRYANIDVYPVGRIRGCGMNCEFCTVKGKPRRASPERLLEHIRWLLETCDARRFFIVDDLFGQYRTETIRFCNMLGDYQRNVGRRLDVTVQIRLDKATDTELLTAMRYAGVNTVAIGFESPIKEELETMNKRIQPQKMIDLAKTYRSFGFLLHGMFIFSYPLKQGETISLSVKERVKGFRKFIKKAKIDTLQVLLPVPLPGTELRRRLQRDNRVYPAEDIGWKYYDGNFPTFEPDRPMTADAMQRSIRKIMGRFYNFKYMFAVGIHIFAFPSLVFFLHNMKAGWTKWYRPWRNYLVRFAGSRIIKGWSTEFKKEAFSRKLRQAQQHLKTRSSYAGKTFSRPLELKNRTVSR